MASSNGLGEITDFLREKLAWHEAVICDPQLTQLAKNLASLLLHDFDWRQNGEAYRSQDGLAKRANCTPRGIQKGLSQLAHAGYLEIVAARGRGHTNRYRFARQKTNAGSYFLREKANAGSSDPPEITNAGSSFLPKKANPGSKKHEPRFVQALRETPSPLLSPQPTDVARTSCAVDAPSSASGFPMKPLLVPSEILRQIAGACRGRPRAMGDGYLGACLWDEDCRALHPASELARGIIHDELSPVLRLLGLTLGAPIPGFIELRTMRP